jgi:hypothetical protein
MHTKYILSMAAVVNIFCYYSIIPWFGVLLNECIVNYGSISSSK